MRKWFLMCLVAMAPLAALPLNNPMQSTMINRGVFCDDPCGATFFGMFDVRFGFYGDYIYNTHMEVNRANRHDSIREFSVMTNAGEIDVNFWCFDFFATVGASNIAMESAIRVFQTDTTGTNSNLHVDMETDFSWSIGGRWALYQCGNWGLGIEGQYFSTNPGINSITDEGGAVPTYFNGHDMRYSSWQVGGGWYYSICITDSFSINPYWGAFWTDSKADFGNLTLLNIGTGAQDIELFDIEKDRQYGWAFGVTLLSGDMVTLTAEGRWAGETAAFLSGQIQF